MNEFKYNSFYTYKPEVYSVPDVRWSDDLTDQSNYEEFHLTQKGKFISATSEHLYDKTNNHCGCVNIKNRLCPQYMPSIVPGFLRNIVCLVHTQ